MLLVSVVYNLGHFGIENYTQGIYIVQTSLWISSHFGTESYTWRLDIVQNFWGHFVPKYILEYI